MVNVKPVQLGTNTRMSFAKINEVLEMPNPVSYTHLEQLAVDSLVRLVENGFTE